jgi:hypothetical protein
MDLIGTDEVGWLLLAGWFFTLEFQTLFNKKRGDTWSEVLRYVFGFSRRQTDTGWSLYARRGIFFALAGWFTAHIAFGV